MTNGQFTQEENRALDEIIARRRSIRAFKPEAPPDGLVEQVILAGLQGPYAGLVERGGAPYRLFRVVRQGPLMNKVQDAIKEQAKASLAQLKGEMADGPRPGESVPPGADVGFSRARTFFGELVTDTSAMWGRRCRLRSLTGCPPGPARQALRNQCAHVGAATVRERFRPGIPKRVKHPYGSASSTAEGGGH